MSNINFDTNKTLRYSRQLILKGIGIEGQQKLLKSKVVVVGAGGLGSPVLQYLAGAGVGTLGIVDFDVVGISNIHRQVIYNTEDIGRKKVNVAKDKLRKINKDVTVKTYSCRIGISNVEEIIKDYDIVVDALDNFPSRYILTDACYFLKKPIIEGAAIDFSGIVTTIIPDKSPCYRCLYPYPPPDGVLNSCSDVGILGAVTGTIGSLQALEVIKVIVGTGKVLTGKLLFFDAFSTNFEEIALVKSDGCPLCGKNPTITELIEYEIKCKSKTDM